MEQKTTELRFAELRKKLTEAWSQLESGQITEKEAAEINKAANKELRELQKATKSLKK